MENKKNKQAMKLLLLIIAMMILPTVLAVLEANTLVPSGDIKLGIGITTVNLTCQYVNDEGGVPFVNIEILGRYDGGNESVLASEGIITQLSTQEITTEVTVGSTEQLIWRCLATNPGFYDIYSLQNLTVNGSNFGDAVVDYQTYATYPDNNNQAYNKNQTFSCTLDRDTSDAGSLDTMALYTNVTETWGEAATTSVSTGSGNTTYNFTVDLPVNESRQSIEWGCFAYDSAGPAEEGWSENRTLFSPNFNVSVDAPLATLNFINSSAYLGCYLQGTLLEGVNKTTNIDLGIVTNTTGVSAQNQSSNVLIGNTTSSWGYAFPPIVGIQNGTYNWSCNAVVISDDVVATSGVSEFTVADTTPPAESGSSAGQAQNKAASIAGAIATAMQMVGLTVTNAQSDDAQAGNITLLNLSTSTRTGKWAGYIGSVNANLTLGSSGDTLFTFGNAPKDQIKSVFSSTDSNFNFGNFSAAAVSDIDTTYGFTTSDADSATSIFTDGTVNISQVDQVPVANLTAYNSARTVLLEYQTGIFKDDGTVASGSYDTLAYGVSVNKEQYAFDNVTKVDYELMVPVNTSGLAGTQTYFFFLDIE